MTRWTRRGSKKTGEAGEATINGVEIDGKHNGLWIAKGIVLSPRDETVGPSSILYIAQLPVGSQKTISALDIGPNGVTQYTAGFVESTTAMGAIDSDIKYLLRGRSGHSLLRPPMDDFSAWEAEGMQCEYLEPKLPRQAFSMLAAALAEHRDRTPVHVDMIGVSPLVPVGVNALQ